MRPPMLPVVSRQKTTSTCGLFLSAGTSAAATVRPANSNRTAAHTTPSLAMRNMDLLLVIGHRRSAVSRSFSFLRRTNVGVGLMNVRKTTSRPLAQESEIQDETRDSSDQSLIRPLSAENLDGRASH